MKVPSAYFSKFDSTKAALIHLSCALFLLTLYAEEVFTSSTDSSIATASVSNDLLQTSLSSHNWQTNNNINNGTTGAFNSNSGANPGNITGIGTYDFNLDLTTNPSGYDISQINSFTGWDGSRAGQRYTVFFSVVDDASFFQVGPTVDVSADGESLVTNLFNNTGALLGSGVDVIRFVVGANGNDNVWREIDVIGSGASSGVINFSATPLTVSPGAPVTLAWEVGAATTSISINQGVGDVTSLTSNGVGAITLNTGPSETTAYTISATLPTRVSQADAIVTVSLLPIISSYSASNAFVNPGDTSTLSWDVQNSTSLFLNNVEVTGQTSLVVNPSGQANYVLTATNANGATEQELIVFGVSEGEVIISEFVASNDSLADEDGDTPDWIEIYNPTSTTANLAGYALTDDSDLPQKWTFPTTSLGAGQRLIVFASNKDRAVSGSELHTNFSLSANGEYLALIKPDGLTAATEFSPEYPSQRSDISFGYNTSERGFRFFLNPSPGSTNVDAFLGFVEDTSFSVDRGFYETAFSLEITSDTDDAVIRYTLDGSEPNEITSLVYDSGPITISETTVVRAAAFKDGFLPTNIDTQTYIFPADVLTQPDMRPEVVNDSVYGPQLLGSLASIPTIAFSFEGDDIDRNEIPLSVEFLNFDSGDTQVNAGAARFGNFVTNFEKRSFRLHFRSEYGASRLDFPLFDNRTYQIPPVESFNSLDLRSSSHDMVRRGAYLANPFADDAMIDMGHVAPHGRFVHLYFNGHYRGMYHLRERWDADMVSSYLPGEEEEYDTINANNVGRNFRTGDLQDGDLDEWQQIQNNLANVPRFETVKDLLDLNNVIDFMLLFTSGTCESEFRAGGSSENGVGFKFFLKDADGFLQPPNGNNLPPGGFYPATHNGPLNSMTLLRSEAHPDFMALLGDRIHRQMFNNGQLTPEGNAARYLRRLEECRMPYFAEFARWESHDNNRDIARTPEQWEAYHQFFFDTRFPVLTDQRIQLMRAANMYPDIEAPVYSQHGGTLSQDGFVTLTVPDTVSKLYYLSGSADTNPDIYVNSLDPRLPGGAINPAATIMDFAGASGGSVNFIETGDAWNYLDDGSNQGTAWRASSFNDSSWEDGLSPLGYGESNLGTTVSFGSDSNNKFATTYFRKTFTVDDPSVFEDFSLRFLRDDGIAIYLNGSLIAQDNLIAGATSSTYTGNAIGGVDESTYLEITLAANTLLAGENTLAVEIHQAAPTSSDIRFDLQLTGNPPGSSNTNSVQIHLTEPGWLLARSYDQSSGEWSALNEAFFTIDTVPADSNNLVVSKIHYNPADPTEAEIAIADDNDDYEFIELMNAGSQTIDLDGVVISEGISFTFGGPSLLRVGERIIIAKNRAAFEARYANTLGSVNFATDILGSTSGYSGKLSNGGEQLIITDALGNNIHDFAYDDSLPWPTAPDGDGYTLVLRNPTTLPDHGVATNWAASAVIGGSPGIGSEVGFIGNPDADNDHDGLTALQEYALSSSDSQGGDSTITAGVADFLVGDTTGTYLMISYLRNQHALNVVNITAEVSTDLITWTSVPDVTLVSEIDNNDGTTTVTYRSSTPVGDTPEGKEFMRIVVSTTP